VAEFNVEPIDAFVTGRVAIERERPHDTFDSPREALRGSYRLPEACWPASAILRIAFGDELTSIASVGAGGGAPRSSSAGGCGGASRSSTFGRDRRVGELQCLPPGISAVERKGPLKVALFDGLLRPPPPPMLVDAVHSKSAGPAVAIDVDVSEGKRVLNLPADRDVLAKSVFVVTNFLDMVVAADGDAEDFVGEGGG